MLQSAPLPARRRPPHLAAVPVTDLSKGAARLLGALATPGSATRADPAREDGVIVQAPGRAAGISLGRGAHALASLRELLSADLVEAAPGEAAGRAGRCVISQVGRAFLRRRAGGDVAEAFAGQQREVVRTKIAGEAGPERVEVNAGESPLAWLRRRRDRDGEPMIDAACFEAGERLRRDLTFAGMLPSVTARWEASMGAGPGGARDPAGATDAVIAARQRVRQALAAAGGEMADLLVDLCGFLKGLETIERDRGWPPRSGKVVVRLALRQLARHYGLETEASGPAASRGIRAWEDGRGPA